MDEPTIEQWTILRAPVPGEGKNFPQAAPDGQPGRVWIISQEGISTFLRLVAWENGQKTVDRMVSLPPGMRASGYALTDAGDVWCYTHGGPEGNAELRLHIAEWVPRVGGAPPPPGPPPEGDYITRDEAQALIAAAFGPVPAATVAAIVHDLQNGGTALNSALEGYFIAMFQRHLGVPDGQRVITLETMGQAYADSPQIMQQLDNRVYATLLKWGIIEMAYKFLGKPWPPPPEP